MIRHIVSFRMRSTDSTQKSIDIASMRAALVALSGVIPDVTQIEVHSDLNMVPGHWDAVLISEHPSNASLEAYQAHPAHREAVTLINSLVEDRAVVDFEVQDSGGLDREATT
jgi:hypothetical protein